MTCRDETAAAKRLPVLSGRATRGRPAALRHACTRRGRDHREQLRQQIVATTPNDGLVARAASGGLVGLIGQPARLFPDLALTPVSLSMRLSSAGYLPSDADGSVGPIAGFPEAFASLTSAIADASRRRRAGRPRVVRATVSPPAVPAATVAVDGMWSTLPPANWIAPSLMEAPNIVSLEPGLYAPRIATSVIRQRNLTLQPLLAKQLLFRRAPASSESGCPIATAWQSARAGDRQRRRRRARGHPDRADRHERRRRRVRVDPARAPDRASAPTERLHARHTGGALAPDQFARAGVPAIRRGPTRGPRSRGDGVEIDDGVAPREYPAIGRFATTSDTNGYFRLPPISRVALARLQGAARRLHQRGSDRHARLPRRDAAVTVAME